MRSDENQLPTTTTTSNITRKKEARASIELFYGIFSEIETGLIWNCCIHTKRHSNRSVWIECLAHTHIIESHLCMFYMNKFIFFISLHLVWNGQIWKQQKNNSRNGMFKRAVVEENYCEKYICTKNNITHTPFAKKTYDETRKILVIVCVFGFSSSRLVLKTLLMHSITLIQHWTT